MLSLPLAAAKEAEGPPSAYGVIDDVSYYMAAGLVNGSGLAHDAGGGERRIDFLGCAFAQFRPEFGRGRLAVDGLVDGDVQLKLEMSDFDATKGDYVRANATLDAATDHALPEGAQARGELAARGLAEMHAGYTLDDMGNTVMANFTDPLSGEPLVHAAVFVTRDGMRDRATGERQAAITSGDDEVHVLVESDAGTRSQSDRFAFGPPAVLPDDSAFPDSEHLASYAFTNGRYGGTAKVTVTLTAKAPPGANEITVSMRSPDGFEAGNTTVTASLAGGGSATFEVPLDQMGDYQVLARGRLLMGNYRVDVELVPPPAFKLDFWWEDVMRGDAARSANNRCKQDLGLRAQVVDANVQRHRPPSFPMELVVLAVAVCVAVGMFLVRLAYDTFSSAEFQKSFKK